ncbi:aminoglycoside phosphotransferase family protein [Paenibacillus dokdonensis]|uniref:Aminoglycoside phosphotransferase family protein n=1 Tax=Paenibacillus dokdonensis TaxID=2567944 RepID=A0ABU6GM25_9BACL|nr:aminoglycoside phosphotransferase family protein [Paenibacillus dokdonensis]MEC0239291.1 aminoglycoside phosphotransferase family protein [Paenibacillus dokdonensis]
MNKSEGIIASGRTAELLAYEPQRVLKLFREGFPLRAVEQEFRVSREVYASGLRVPEPFEMKEHNGRMGIVYEEADGLTMLAAISRDPGIIKEEAGRMARLHAEIHKRKVDGLPRQKAMLADQITEAPFLTEEEKGRTIAGLDLLEDDSWLCHGDYHPDNIMLGHKEWIIDWMTAMSGSPAADVARTLLLLRTGTLPEELPPPVQELFARIREQLTVEYLQEYMKLTDISHEQVERWMVPIAAARLVEWIPPQEKEQLLKLIRAQAIDPE